MADPYLVYVKRRRPFAFAGIWDEWKDNKTGKLVRGCAIVTTVSNGLVQIIPYHRSPVILDERQEPRWLNVKHPLAVATAMLHPYPSSLMNAYPISPRIKDTKLDDRSLVDPVGERITPEYKNIVSDKVEIQGWGSQRGRTEDLVKKNVPPSPKAFTEEEDERPIGSTVSDNENWEYM